MLAHHRYSDTIFKVLLAPIITTVRAGFAPKTQVKWKKCLKSPKK